MTAEDGIAKLREDILEQAHCFYKNDLGVRTGAPPINLSICPARDCKPPGTAYIDEWSLVEYILRMKVCTIRTTLPQRFCASLKQLGVALHEIARAPGQEGGDTKRRRVPCEEATWMVKYYDAYGPAAHSHLAWTIPNPLRLDPPHLLIKGLVLQAATFRGAMRVSETLSRRWRVQLKGKMYERATTSAPGSVGATFCEMGVANGNGVDCMKRPDLSYFLQNEQFLCEDAKALSPGDSRVAEKDLLQLFIQQIMRDALVIQDRIAAMMRDGIPDADSTDVAVLGAAGFVLSSPLLLEQELHKHYSRLHLKFSADWWCGRWILLALRCAEAAALFNSLARQLTTAQTTRACAQHLVGAVLPVCLLLYPKQFFAALLVDEDVCCVQEEAAKETLRQDFVKLRDVFSWYCCMDWCIVTAPDGPDDTWRTVTPCGTVADNLLRNLYSSNVPEQVSPKLSFPPRRMTWSRDVTPAGEDAGFWRRLSHNVVPQHLEKVTFAGDLLPQPQLDQFAKSCYRAPSHPWYNARYDRPEDSIVVPS